ncbi:MAG: uracil-xanthine permease [Clostridia bacterium]|nr:uracil-xanthine permease [Clostridia bacterium]
MQLVYNVEDKPNFGKTLLFAFQQLLAIMAATIAVPAIIGNGMSATAALFGAGIGTIVYLLFTRSKSPVFLGSSFAFIGSMFAAFGGAASAAAGYLGLILGALFAGLVYVVLAIIVKAVGTGWIDKLMPAVVIGPTVAIIGLSLAGNAVGDLMSGNVMAGEAQAANPYVCLIIGLITLFVTMFCSVFGKKMLKLIPFIIGIVVGYVLAAILTAIGNAAGIDALKIIDFSKFAAMTWVPDFSFLTAVKGFGDLSASYVLTLLVAYAPVAFVVFAEHIADHKNLSTIINRDLLKEPGLDRTLLGDGIGSFCGAIFGGCPNTTYGESIACVAISGNASVRTIWCTAFLAIIISFFGPFATFLATIPKCVMGGVCMALYGFIAVSGLKMIQKVDLNENPNMFVVSVILIAGIGGLSVNFGSVTITEVASALILGIITNLVLRKKQKKA